MRYSLVILAVLLVAACSDDPLTEPHRGETIAVTVGDTFIVELESNPSTGFTWVVDQGEGMDLLDERWRGDDDVTGSPGIAVLTFEVTDSGLHHLVLRYTRPWSEDGSLDRHFDLFVEAATAD